MLLVEDEELVLQMGQDSLEEAGFRVVAARQGEAALIAFDDFFDSISVVVTDVNLGPGLTGWDVARAVRERKASVGLLFVTGDSAHAWAAQGVPGSVLIDKPFAPIQVVTAVASMLTKTMTSL